jgi:hypothetical protein
MNDAVRKNLPQDPRAVFVAMPFNTPHSEDLYVIVEHVCKQIDLQAIRADRFVKAGPITRDIREAIARAGIVVADLTGLNPNVLYEVGLANADYDRVIILHDGGTKLPFDLNDQRAISYSLSTPRDRMNLHQNLWAALSDMKPSTVPLIIEGKLERSKRAIQDLQRHLQSPATQLASEPVWFSGFLSTLAISERERFSDDETEYRDALLEDKRLFIELARGCPIRLIISPPHPGKIDDAIAEGKEVTIQRLETLLAFLSNVNEPALKSMEFAVSPFRQKHVYIVGNISASEGFKIKLDRGYELTLVHEHPEAISASISAQRILFERLKRNTLLSYNGPNPPDSREALLKCATAAIEASLQTVRSI